MPIYGARILVLIPHPDDEVVGVAAAIARAKAEGARVFALYLGHGCLARATLRPWQRKHYEKNVAMRLKEAQAAADFLGLHVVGQNTQRAAREIWPNLTAVREEIVNAIRACAPDRVWVPAYEGGNPDHDALNAVAATFDTLPVYEFSEYHLAGGMPQANTFIAAHGNEMVLNLTAQEQEMKRHALSLYASEKGNVKGLLRAHETLRPLKPYDYAARPHEGTLWYERFQWVPFRHPRVDYTKAEEVSKAITDFLQNV